MILYNVTVKIDKDIESEWLEWMKSIHIPRVMETGYFLDNSIFRLLIEEEDGSTYSIQYRAYNMADIEDYMRECAPALQREHAEKYANKFVSFRTLLQHIA